MELTCNDHTCKNSWRLLTAFFGHKVTDVTRSVTRREKTLDIERPNLKEMETCESAGTTQCPDESLDTLTLKLWECDTFLVMASTLSSPP